MQIPELIITMSQASFRILICYPLKLFQSTKPVIKSLNNMGLTQGPEIVVMVEISRIRGALLQKDVNMKTRLDLKAAVIITIIRARINIETKEVAAVLVVEAVARTLVAVVKAKRRKGIVNEAIPEIIIGDLLAHPKSKVSFRIRKTRSDILLSKKGSNLMKENNQDILLIVEVK